ncbi:UNVERIFIED_CONTAM: hypothetical protein Sindi_1706000 [Sesamum indicum]
MRIPRSSSYDQFLSKIYKKIGVDSSRFSLNVSAKHSCQYLGRIKETLIPIKDDDTLSFFTDPTAGFPLMEIFVETVEIEHDDAPQIGRGWGAFDSRQLVDDNSQMSQPWGEYMAMLSSQGFPSSSNYENFTGTYNSNFDAGTSNRDFGAGTSNYDTDCYTPNVVSVTQGLDNIELNYTEPTHSHTPSTSHFILTSAQHIAEPKDPIADSLANESDAASEPDEVDYPIPPEDGIEDVDINVVAENVAQGTSTSSQPVTPQRTSQETFYRSIPFFEQTFPEVPVDSIDVPNLRYAKFYDKNEGRLDVGMLFKNKEALIEAVKDHSIRYARREYWVPESSKTKWKVLCRHTTEAMRCRWELRGIYKPKMRSLKIAREMVYGTWESSVQKLPKYLGALQKYNPGTIVEWQHKARDTSTGAYVIGYVFWAFKPCIEGFQHCRNLISVDRTHLYTKYKHKMLIAAAMDGNQQGDGVSALFLTAMLVSQELYVNVRISCHLTACTDIACGIAGSEYQIRKFNRTMEEIKKQSLEAFQWLDRINKEKWTASQDGGWRCGILTTNMSECINGVLKGARRLPLTAIAEMTFQRSVHYFRERLARSTVMLTNNQLWTDFAYKMFTRWHQNSVEHTVTKYHQFQQSASVVTRRHGGHGVNTHVVKIANRECSCGKWTQFGIPCSHAQKVCAAFMINAASMVKDYYDIMTYKNIYSKSFEPVHSEDYWDVPGFELVHDPTIRISSRPGRNQTTRIHNEMDWAQRRARQQAQQRNSSTQSDVPVPGSQD